MRGICLSTTNTPILSSPRSSYSLSGTTETTKGASIWWCTGQAISYMLWLCTCAQYASYIQQKSTPRRVTCDTFVLFSESVCTTLMLCTSPGWIVYSMDGASNTSSFVDKAQIALLYFSVRSSVEECKVLSTHIPSFQDWLTEWRVRSKERRLQFWCRLE